MFTPHLTLVPNGKRYSLFAQTEVPNGSYSAGKAELGAPEFAPVGAGVVACQLHLAHEAAPAAQISKIVEHRTDLKLKEGDTVSAFVVLDGRVLGSGSLVLSRGRGVGLGSRRAMSTAPASLRTLSALATATERPPLTSELCQAITVRNTPQPGDFTGPTQTLDKLGVIDDTQAKAHKAGIQQDLNDIHWHIEQGDIQSGPAKTVRDCSDSIENNAF